MLDADACGQLDAAAAHAATFDALRRRFTPGAAGTVYLDANSIGPMPADAPARMQAVMDAGWRVARRRSWNELDWLAQPRLLGQALAPVLGAGADDVRVAESTSVNQYRLLRLALALKAPRRVIVAETDVFPSNRYVAEGLAHAGDAVLRLLPTTDGRAADDAALQGMRDAALEAALAPGDVAVVALSAVDYRSSRRHDLARIARRVHAAGALVLWDLSHAAGAVAVDLRGSDADLAVGCGYKYLCGGPGAPSFVYVHPRWQDATWPAVCGWMGHADTFAFDPAFRPAPGMDRHLVGTPAVLANTAFGAAADIWRDVDPLALDARHRSLTDTLVRLLDEQCAGLGVELASPREHARRGGHVALRFEGAGPLAQALVAHGVVVSARKPDALRLGVHPLTTTHAELWQAVQVLRHLLESGAWREPRFQGPSV
ncbi:MAG: aminotransferase class V-fold PLP-dependent enzyme [Rubrivivax sp.]